jgi:hypothetical protein
MKYEDLYEYIGEIGRYQWFIFSLVFIFSMYTVDSIHMNFIGGKMQHWCRVEELLALPYDVQKSVAIPTVSDSGDGATVEYSSCKMFAFNYSSFNETEFATWNRTEMISDDTPVVSCDRWTYDQSTFESTIVSKVRTIHTIDC